MTRTRVQILFTANVLILATLLTGCGSGWPIGPIGSTARASNPDTQLPTYPGARQITVKNQGRSGIPETVFSVERTEFVTDDSLEAVIDFYRVELTRAGWELTYEQTSSTPHNLVFDWEAGCPPWDVSLVTDRTARGWTRVQLDLRQYRCF